MTRRLVLTYLALTMFLVLILEIPLGLTFARQERNAVFAALERDASVIASLVEDGLERDDPTQARSVAADYLAKTGGRVVIVDEKGLSVADTDSTLPLGRSFSGRPEFQDALEGRVASGVRYSQTLGMRLMVIASPVASGGVVYGAVRISYPATTLDRKVRSNWIALLLVGLTVLAATSVVGWLLARSVTKPVRALEQAAASIAEGDLTAHAPTDIGPPEIRELASTFNEMEHRLGVLLDTQRSFVAEASHQLRTPLTALRLRLENLERHVADAGAHTDLEAAIAESWRLGQIVDGLLALARADAVPPERMSIDATAVAEERVRMWAALAAERDVHLRMEAPAAGTEAWSVPGGLEQIIDNFLANAMEVAPRGSTIVVTVAQTPRWLEVHVIDQGPGLDPAGRSRAFDRFWRAPAAKGRGSGLGLSIVRRLAEASGGMAELLAGPEGGIDAIVRLRPSGVPATPSVPVGQSS